MQKGQTVRLRAHDGSVIERVVVGIRPGLVVVSRKDEYEAAEREGREPLSVGFEAEYVVAES